MLYILCIAETDLTCLVASLISTMPMPRPAQRVPHGSLPAAPPRALTSTSTVSSCDTMLCKHRTCQELQQSATSPPQSTPPSRSASPRTPAGVCQHSISSFRCLVCSPVNAASSACDIVLCRRAAGPLPALDSPPAPGTGHSSLQMQSWCVTSSSWRGRRAAAVRRRATAQACWLPAFLGEWQQFEQLSLCSCAWPCAAQTAAGRAGTAADRGLSLDSDRQLQLQDGRETCWPLHD